MSSADIVAERMVSQVSEFSDTERRFRRYRCLMVAFFVTLMLSLIVYLLLTWEISEEPRENKDKDSVTFSTILVVSISTLAVVSVLSFVILECIRRKSIRQLIEMQSQEMMNYYDGRSTRHISHQVSQPSSSLSDHSSWMAPPASEASSPPPAYDDCIR